MPDLFVIAGPNGAGKSFNSQLILPIQSFDYDKLFLQLFKADPTDHELKHEIISQKATNIFNESVKKAISNKSDFAYETNFNGSKQSAFHWPNLFKNEGYKIHLRFIALSSLELCQERVNIRVKMGGHDVSHDQIRDRYSEGLKNVNSLWSFFNSFHLLDSSSGDLRAIAMFEKKITKFKNVVYSKKEQKPVIKIETLEKFVIEYLPPEMWMARDFHKIFDYIKKHPDLTKDL